MMNAESLREFQFLQENIKGICCPYFHTFLKRNVQRINRIQSQKCEWSHWKEYDQKIYNSLHTMCILLTPWCRVLLEKLTGLELVKKFPAFLRNPKVHYRTHKRPPTVPILGQPNPVHIPTSHLMEIHPNIIHPSTPRSPQWYLSLRFSHQDHRVHN